MAKGFKSFVTGAAMVYSYHKGSNTAGVTLPDETIIGKAKALRDRPTILLSVDVRSACPTSLKGVIFRDPTDRRSACEASLKMGIFQDPSNVRPACKLGSKCYVLFDPARSVCKANLKMPGLGPLDVQPIDSRGPIKVTAPELKKLLEAMLFTIRGGGAHAIHPITAVELDWSLWTRDAEEQEFPACREPGIGGIVINPYGKGFCTSCPRLRESLADNYFPRTQPRFQEENIENTKNIYGCVNEMARMEGCTPLQLGLDDAGSIPGATIVENFNQNVAALSVKLTPENMAKLETIASADAAKRGRYGASFIKILGSLQTSLNEDGDMDT